MNRKLLLLAFAGLTLGSMFCGPTHADDPIDPIVQRLLVDHWDKNKKNRESSKILFDQSDSKEQVLMAYTLNRIKHNRLREARTPADELTQRYPANMDGWILRVWLDAVTDNYDRSLISMQLMKREMKKQADLDANHVTDLHLRLARIIGYLQGPVSRKVNAPTLNTVLLQVVDGMTPEQLKQFNDERTRVLNLYDQLAKQNANLQAQETQKEKASAAVETKAIETQNKAIDTRRTQIQPEMARIQTEGDQKISVVESQLSPLQQELAGLASTIGSMEFSLQNAFQERLFQQSLLFRERDPFVRALIRDRLIQLDFEMGRIQSDLFSARSRADSVAIQANQLAAERNRIGNQYSNQLNQLGHEARQNDRQQRRNNTRLQKLARGTTTTSPKVRVAKVETSALTTYDPFPIELVRQAYLDSLKADNLP